MDKKTKIHLIDLEQSILMLRRALNFIREIYEKRGSIFLYGGEGESSKNFSGETQSTPIAGVKGLTGLRETLGSKQRRRVSRMQKNQMSRRKKSLNSSSREKISVILKTPQVIEDLVPRALLILDPNKNTILVKEAIKLQLPIVAILDNKSDPSGIQFPIPGNGANSSESPKLYISCVMNAIKDGKKNELKKI